MPLLIGIAGFLLLLPFDGPLSHAASGAAAALPGDLRRELHAWMQYGQGVSLALTAAAVWLLDPPRRRRLLDLLLAAGVAWVVSLSAKLLIGRPRPRPEFEDPNTFLGPMGVYPVSSGRAEGGWKLVHAWDGFLGGRQGEAGGGGTDLWSMPSSHTLMAMVLSVFLATVYPALRWPAALLVLVVATGRVLFDAHWPTDVLVGACLGYAVGMLIIPRFRGVRALDAFWRRAVNRGAVPSFPLAAADAAARQAAARANQ